MQLGSSYFSLFFFYSFDFVYTSIFVGYPYADNKLIVSSILFTNFLLEFSRRLFYNPESNRYEKLTSFNSLMFERDALPVVSDGVPFLAVFLLISIVLLGR